MPYVAKMTNLTIRGSEIIFIPVNIHSKRFEPSKFLALAKSLMLHFVKFPETRVYILICDTFLIDCFKVDFPDVFKFNNADVTTYSANTLNKLDQLEVMNPRHLQGLDKLSGLNFAEEWRSNCSEALRLLVKHFGKNVVIKCWDSKKENIENYGAPISTDLREQNNFSIVNTQLINEGCHTFPAPLYEILMSSLPDLNNNNAVGQSILKYSMKFLKEYVSVVVKTLKDERRAFPNKDIIFIDLYKDSSHRLTVSDLIVSQLESSEKSQIVVPSVSVTFKATPEEEQSAIIEYLVDGLTMIMDPVAHAEEFCKFMLFKRLVYSSDTSQDYYSAKKVGAAPSKPPTPK